jgi:predicted phage replisome organizer
MSRAITQARGDKKIMADVKWIKIVTDIFDDEKILLVESMPESDAMIVIWFKLLTLAGKINNGGVLLFNDKLPYTDEMLATIFRRPINTVRLAISTFEKFGMIEVINNAITIPNWSKHQTLDQLENKKEYMRTYMQEYREKQKLIAEGKEDCKTNSKTNSKANVSSLDKDIDKEIDKEIDKDKEIDINKKHKYGEYKNVLLTDKQLEQLKEKFPCKWEYWINTLSEGIELKGYKYKNHYLAITKWASKDKKGGESNGKYGNRIKFDVPKIKTESSGKSLDEEIAELGLI